MKDLADIVLRKQQLIARCAAQRAAIGGAVRDLERPIAVADRILAVVRFFREHPLVLAGAVAAIVAVRRRTLFGLAARGITAWRLWWMAGVWMQRFGVHFPRSRSREKAGHVAS